MLLEHTEDRAAPKIDTRCAIASAFPALAFACALVLGRQLDADGRFHDAWPTMFAVALVFVAAWLACYALFRSLASAPRLSHRIPRQIDADGREADENLKRCTRICLIALACSWILWFLLFAPGIYGYDAAIQYLEFTSEEFPVIDQWSIVYGWTYTHFVNLGSSLLGSKEAGFVIWITLQGAFVYYAGSKIILLLARRHRKQWPVIATTAFLSLTPPLPMIALSSTYDAFFMGCFGLIIVHFIEMTDSPRQYWSSIHRPIALSATMLLFLLMRSNGFYILLLTIPFCVLLPKGFQVKLLICMLVPLALFQVYRGPMLDELGIYKGVYLSEAIEQSGYQTRSETEDPTKPGFSEKKGSRSGMNLREMLSIPFQQLARVYVQDKNHLSSEELELFERYFPSKEANSPLDSYAHYPCISDSIKLAFNAEEFDKDPLEFAAFYLAVGAKSPKTYTEAALLANIGLWYPGKTYPDSRMYHPYIESETYPDVKQYNENYVEIGSFNLFPHANEALQYLYGSGQEHFAQTPILGLLSKSGGYFLLLLFVVFYQIYRRRWRSFLILAPLLLLELSVAAGPVTLCRYISAIIFTAPLLIATLKTKKPPTP